MKQKRLISSVAQLVENIKSYHKGSQILAELMPYNRAWYALRSKDGWLFGPSKFVGYEDPNPQEYLKRDGTTPPQDGRVTERVLQKWSELVEAGHPEHNELHTALNEFCAQFGKNPNSLARISIVKTRQEESVPAFEDELVSLMIAVYRKLTPAQKSAFRKQAA